VENEWAQLKDDPRLMLDQKEIDRVKGYFTPPAYAQGAERDITFNENLAADKNFRIWVGRNVKSHKIAGYRAVMISLKAPDKPPGDATDRQMDFIADLADQYSCREIVVTHDQNLVLPHVKQADLYLLWQALQSQELATPNIGLLTDMICCPGLDFCSLANAGSIPIAKQINEKFTDLDYLHDIGEIKIKMSGCMNACGHHHVGHIGILGVDKKGVEFYQLTLGGSAENDAALGDRLGPAIEKARVADAIGKILDVYVENRTEDERFLDTYRRIGMTPFKARVYSGSEYEMKEAQAVAGY
jgi:sulfite reductase (NADPH) hemoprotein beta-component